MWIILYADYKNNGLKFDGIFHMDLASCNGSVGKQAPEMKASSELFLCRLVQLVRFCLLCANTLDITWSSSVRLRLNESVE